MNTQSASATTTSQFSKWPAVLALAFGLLVVYGAGFSHPMALHNATHDTRHAFGLPCH
jgi:cobalt transporter subunit CbtB